MARRTRIKLVGKHASFEAEKWARAIEALAHQLRRERNHEDPDAASALSPEEDHRA